MPENNYQKQEKDCVGDQAADIQNLSIDLNKCNQLIVV
jgi:hypothetical protein